MKTAVMKIGERIIVRPDPKKWTVAAFESLNGQRGVIVDDGQDFPPRALVRLDEHPRKWWNGQQPSREWWFEEHEMESAP